MTGTLAGQQPKSCANVLIHQARAACSNPAAPTKEIIGLASKEANPFDFLAPSGRTGHRSVPVSCWLQRMHPDNVAIQTLPRRCGRAIAPAAGYAVVALHAVAACHGCRPPLGWSSFGPFGRRRVATGWRVPPCRDLDRAHEQAPAFSELKAWLVRLQFVCFPPKSSRRARRQEWARRFRRAPCPATGSGFLVAIRSQ